MDFNEEEEVLFSLRDMEDSDEEQHENGVVENGNTIIKHSSHQQGNKVSLAWLDLRVFYVRFSKCVIQEDSIPECLTVHYVDALLEINGIRTSMYADGVSSLLKRDRLDKRSEEVTFVSTDSIRMAGSVKFEVFCKEDLLVLSGMLEFCPGNGFIGDSKSSNHWQGWSMNCESDVHVGAGFLRGNQNNHTGLDSISPAIEVYVAGCYSSIPIILSKTLQISHGKKQKRRRVLDSIPEYEVRKMVPSPPSKSRKYSRCHKSWEIFKNMSWNFQDSEIDGGTCFNAEYSQLLPLYFYVTWYAISTGSLVQMISPRIASSTNWKRKVTAVHVQEWSISKVKMENYHGSMLE